MAIQIKRSANTAKAPSLEVGELAWSSNGEVIFVGNGSAVVAVAGKRVPGTLTANQAIVGDANSFLDEIKTGGVITSKEIKKIKSIMNNLEVIHLKEIGHNIHDEIPEEFENIVFNFLDNG